MKLTRPRLLVLLLALAIAAWLVLFFIERSYDEGPNYSRIEDDVFLGGDEPQPPSGTRAVLNLCEFKDPYEAEVHLWESIRDAEPAPDRDWLEWLERMVRFVDLQRQEGRPIYVHCRNGVSRSAMVLAGYYMWKNNWTRDEALDFIRARRPQIRPNPAFRDLLLEWEKKLREQTLESRLQAG